VRLAAERLAELLEVLLGLVAEGAASAARPALILSESWWSSSCTTTLAVHGSAVSTSLLSEAMR
jgi:hypothetical protein